MELAEWKGRHYLSCGVLKCMIGIEAGWYRVAAKVRTLHPIQSGAKWRSCTASTWTQTRPFLFSAQLSGGGEIEVLHEVLNN